LTVYKNSVFFWWKCNLEKEGKKMSAEKNVAVATVPEGDRIYASVMHLSVSIGWIWGMFDIGISSWFSLIPSFILPIGMWLAARNNAFIYQQGRSLAKFILLATILAPLVVVMVGGFIAYSADGASESARKLVTIIESDREFPLWVYFVFLVGMIEDMNIWMIFKFGLWGIVLGTALRPVTSPLLAAYRAMKGKESDYD